MLYFITEYWVEILFSLLVTVITHLYRKIFKYVKKIDIIEEQACLNLKMHILEKYGTIRKKKYITLEEKEEIMNFYNIYKKLECSNIVEEIIKELANIPLK